MCLLAGEVGQSATRSTAAICVAIAVRLYGLVRRRGQSLGLGVRCVQRSSSWPPYGRLVSLSRRCETWVLGLCIGEACGKPLSDVPSLRQGPVCETNRSYRQDRVRQLPLIGAALPALGSAGSVREWNSRSQYLHAHETYERPGSGLGSSRRHERGRRLVPS